MMEYFLSLILSINGASHMQLLVYSKRILKSLSVAGIHII